MAEVALRQVSKTYAGGVVAVRDVSLTIPDGNLCVLVGPSGCGKSTLLHLLGGLDRDFEGEAKVLGCDLRALSDPELAAPPPGTLRAYLWRVSGLPYWYDRVSGA